MPDKVAKAYAINDARIMFVSLVGKAANKHQFLITKSEDGKADFQTYGRILKADAGSHFVTGIVYEPMVEDTDGNYMTEEEITKAAHWFAKNGNKVDLQHSFEPLDGAVVVESSVTKCDMELEGQAIRKGTWLMTVEIQDEEIYKAIEKGEITGFSMGGSGVYSEVDVDITEPDGLVEKGKAKGIFKQFAKLFGLEVVEKGKVKDTFKRTSVRDNFWNAYYALSECLLDVYNPETERWEFQHAGYGIRAAQVAECPAEPSVSDVPCHFHLKDGLSVVQKEPYTGLVGTVKLTLPFGTRIQENDFVRSKETGHMYRAEVPRAVHGNHHLVVELRREDGIKGAI